MGSKQRKTLVEDRSTVARFAARVGRHVSWGRSQGVGRLIEEDQLNPLERLSNAARKWAWRRAHGRPPGSAVPVYLVGLQRSGTNMVVHGLEAAPEFEVHNENDRAVYRRFRLRSDAVVRDVVKACRHSFVLFKPLCDSHRVDELLDGLDTPSAGKALWVYRSFEGRVRSAVAKFGDDNLTVMELIAEGRTENRWQAQRLSPDSLELIRSFDYETMTPESASALFWFVRNAIYFEAGLDTRPDVMLVAYERMLADPDGVMRAVCDFLNFRFDPRLTGHIARRPTPLPRPLAIDPRIRERCEDLSARLDEVAQAHAAGARRGMEGA